MSKIITVWGNPGCGKSMFCTNLAKVLTAGKEKAIIINADSSTPMLPVWMPDRILESSTSLGNVLSCLDINMAIVAERVAILKDYPFIGVMGYAAGETPFSYPELKYDKIKLFISEASKLVDYIILDCSSNMLNFFTPTAIESADLVIRILTPDLRGLNYLRAHKPLLTDDKFHYNDHLTFAGMARPFHALDEMDHLIGGFDGMLPYAKEIERCGTEGQMFHALGYCNQRYIQSLKLVRERLLGYDLFNEEPASPKPKSSVKHYKSGAVKKDMKSPIPDTEDSELWDTPISAESGTDPIKFTSQETVESIETPLKARQTPPVRKERTSHGHGLFK